MGRLRIVALVAYWIALFAATHYPSVPMPRRVEHGDKLIHFFAFGGLALLLWLVLATRGLTARSVWLATAILVPYATVDEFTQQYVGRYSDVADWLANLGGIGVVLALAERQRRRR